MNPETRLHQELFAVLQDIKKEQLTLVEGADLIYRFKDEEKAKKLNLPISYDEQDKILNKLEELGAFSVEVLPLDGGWKNALEGQPVPPFLKSNKLVINQLRFDELYDNYGKFSRQYSVKSENNDTVEVTVRKEGQNLFIVSPSERVLIKSLRYGLMPDLLWDYLVVHQAERITRQHLKRDVMGLAGLDDISEIVRQSGFDKDMKGLFFAQIGKDVVWLRNNITLSQEQLKSLVDRSRRKS